MEGLGIRVSLPVGLSVRMSSACPCLRVRVSSASVCLHIRVFGGSRGSRLKICTRYAGLGVHAGVENLRSVHGYGAAREERFEDIRSVCGFGVRAAAP